MELSDMVRSVPHGCECKRKREPNLELLLEDAKAVKEKPEPRPETAQTREDTTAIAARETRDRLARYKVLLVNEERIERED